MTENVLDSGKISITQTTSVNSSPKGTDYVTTNFETSLLDERESNTFGTMVRENENDRSNSPYNFPHSLHTCSKGNGNVFSNEQAVNVGDNDESQTTTKELEPNSMYILQENDNTSGNLLENSAPYINVSQNVQANKKSSSVTNEQKCGETLVCNKSTPMETECIPDSSNKNNHPSENFFSDSSSDEISKIPNLNLKRWDDSLLGNTWYNLKPCFVVLDRYDTMSDNGLFSKSSNSNSPAIQFDNISVLSDIEDESANISEPKPGKLRSKKPHSESFQYKKKERSSFRSKCLTATIKGSSCRRKNNNKVITYRRNTSIDSDMDNDEPNSKFEKKTIQVLAQIHKPPESKTGSDAIVLKTSSQTSGNCVIDQQITEDEMNSNNSTWTDEEKNGKRRRNSSSISSMSFSELLSDTEYVGDKRRIIRPSAHLQPSIQINENQEIIETTSDLDLSDNLDECFLSSEICEKLPTAKGKFHSDSYSLDDIDISKITFKQCHVVLSRCDANSESLSRSDSNLNFCAAVDQNTCHPSELSDTDEALPSPKNKQRKKLRWAKKKYSGKSKGKSLVNSSGLNNAAKLSAQQQKSVNNSLFMKEIWELKNTMKRAEEKIDKLIHLHLQLLNSDKLSC